MKNRRYHITLNHHEENLSGLRCTEILERARKGIDPKLDTILEAVSEKQHEPDAEEVLTMLRELRETPLRG